MNRTRLPLLALGLLFFAGPALAQYELISGNFNSVFVAQAAGGAAATPSGPPVVADPPPTPLQFAGMGQIASGTGPLSSATVFGERYPANPTKTLILAQATIGGVFASGVPRFSLGDVITPPLTQADGVTVAGADYWRLQPLQAGEIFKIDNTSQAKFPLATVTVSSSAANLTTVTVVAPPVELVVGATILGQPITRISGTNVTLAGNANASITSSTEVTITPATSYYYSPHAEKVFASQAGRVTITWITRAADNNGNYFCKTEDFAVSSTSKLPVRRIYWTEGNFDGPKVQISDARISTVNPVYYSGVPKAVPQEVTIPGNNPLTPNLSTLTFDKFSGIGQLRAYNVEGRIFVEYLGGVRLGGNIHEFIGSDVVEIVRVPEPNYQTVHLGKEISPHEPSVTIAPPPGGGTTAQATATVANGIVTGISIINGGSGYGTNAPVISFSRPIDGSAAMASGTVTNGVLTSITLHQGGSGYPVLTPSPILSSSQNGVSYYGSTVRPNSSTAYFAERETSAENFPDNGSPASQDAYNKVVFYWLEEGEFSIKWPKFQDRYWLRWSPNLNEYAHYTVEPSGGTADTGMPFTGGALPSIIYQDDPSQSEAYMDLSTQRLVVNFAAASDQRNRSLLKFNGNSSVWYVNVYSQAENRAVLLASTTESPPPPTTTITVPSTAGLVVGMQVTGPGISGAATVLSIVNATQLVLSQSIPEGTNVFTYMPNFTLPSMTALPGPTNPFFLEQGTWRVNESPIDATTVIESPLLAVTTAGPVTLNLLHSYEFEWRSDGGRLWVSRNNGPYTAVDVEGQEDVWIDPFNTFPGWTGIQDNVTSNAVLFPDGVVGDTYRFRLEAKWNDILEWSAMPLLPWPKWTIAGITLNNGATLVNSLVLPSTSQSVTTPSVVTVESAAGLEVGMVVTGPGIIGSGVITRIIDRSFNHPPRLVISGNVANGTNLLSFTVQSDGAAPINAAATVGTRLVQPAGHENAGFISSGTGYFPQGYLNPFVVGVEAANQGAIIPVNALPNDKVLTVRWFKKIARPSAEFTDLYVPGKIGRYTVSYPATSSPQIVIAQGIGTGDLSGAEQAGSVYYQNSPSAVGYNPNEEHALPMAPRVYALRDDLNITSGSGYTSEPFVLLAYTDPADDRPAIHAYKVVRSDATYDFDYTATAGTLLVKPYPLPLMPLPMVGAGVSRTSKDVEIVGADAPVNTTVSSSDAYKGFTFKDRKGFTWVHRGPNVDPQLVSSSANGTTVTVPSTIGLVAGMAVSGTGISGTASIVSITNGTSYVLSQSATATEQKWVYSYSPTLSMKLYYLSRAGFFVPGTGEPVVGTVLPFLRAAGRSGQSLNINAIDSNANGTPGGVDEPLTVTYRPAWPTDAPELRVAETLTLPKFGLPQVRGQASAEVYYQQSLANAATSTGLTKNSVTLHDPTREKIVALGSSGVRLTVLPAALKTTAHQGKTYFQGLPPHLQQRIYFDPNRGTKGALVLTGVFHDEIAGEDYLDLNLLTAAEVLLVNGLVPAGATGDLDWISAIGLLNTQVETFKPDPARFGSYIIDSARNAEVDGQSLAVVDSPLTAVDSYAVTATGQGSGFVTMVFGNSGNPDQQPQGDPVQVKVLKVAKQLYVGDLKVVQSSNPLDEQVTLRQSGDFAGKPEDYQFEWRWTTGAATAPGIYSTVMTRRIGDPANGSGNWLVVRDPGSLRPTDAQYTAAGSALPFPRTENVRPVNYVLDAQNRPTPTVIDATSYTAAEIAAGYPSLVVKSATGVNFANGVPNDIVFSTTMGIYDGFVLYVNRQVAIAHNAPSSQFPSSNASTGLSSAGLANQFRIAPSYFTAGANTIEVAVYTTADPNAVSSLDFRLEATVEDDLVNKVGGVWQSTSDPTGINTNVALVGSSPELPFGGPQFVLNDRWFTMRYRPKLTSANVLTAGKATQDAVEWSRWMPPQFVEGWIKRVLAAINPFEQRVKDLYNNASNTDVSVITQAGTRWEGDVALTMSNINDVGLIEIYETVLNRGKDMSIDANTNDSDTNNALTLAAGYLNDLYTILGNEAFADAANPTISLDDQTAVTEVNTSRFSFEGQVSSSLEEELAMLRGRDDFTSPGVDIAPAYNRLYWNYTRGINSGEVIYAVNYNVKEKVGSSTANGVIDESDAQRMFPQGHGDAYGHYLTALTGYYRLLSNKNFTWKPRAEAITVLGQAVTVDYMDERKFAASAGNVARAAEQICALVYRKSYKDDAAAGWGSFRDSKGANSHTGVTSRQGLDEWVSRSTQGAYLHWAVANALIPDVDNFNTGVQKIDRTTVPEIRQLASSGISLQSTIDNANARLNPLGLSAGAVAFDLSPTALKAGQSQFQQVYDRAQRALVNASGAFNQASRMTRSLRNQQNQIDDYNTVIVQQERAYVNQLNDIFGRPYSGDVGPGKTYEQGYVGPDTERWFVVTPPSDLVVTTAPVTVTMRVPTRVKGFTGHSIADVVNSYNSVDTEEKAVTITPNRFAQFADVIGATGNRPQTGALQDALLDSYLCQVTLLKAAGELSSKQQNFARQAAVLQEVFRTHKEKLTLTRETGLKITALEASATILTQAQSFIELASNTTYEISEAAAESLPKSVGLSTDVTAPVRGSIKLATSAVRSKMYFLKYGMMLGAAAIQLSADVLAAKLKWTLEDNDLALEELQLAYEVEAAYRDLLGQHFHLAELMAAKQRADQKAVNIRAQGDRILSEREVFRQRAAAIIQGYRTKDLGFRIFRNEALEQYRSLFDLASSYTYLAAKSYDYEIGLLGTTEGRQVFDKIIASRSLGDLTGGVPQSTVSTLGDAGLAGTMAQLKADFSVAEGRLGINNPDQYGTVFSLRGELYRLLNDPNINSDDLAWQQTLEQHIVPNVMSDADVATYCRNIKKPDGSPVPGIVIPFSTTIEHGKNFFGQTLAAGDHFYTPSNFATKIYSVGIALPGYVGMDTYAPGVPNAGLAASGAPNALSATPYAYLIPCGSDFMLAPPLGDTNTLRSWSVKDQAIPLPYNLGASSFNGTQYFSADGTLSEQPWILRKHQAFRMVSNATAFYSTMPAEFTNSRLIARSVWNSQWKIVIPAYTLSSNEQDGLNRFAASVQDIHLFLRTYSNSGN